MSDIRVALMAAGRSSRYDSCKLTALHPITNQPLICHVIAQYQQAGLHDIVVLTGCWHESIINVLPSTVEVSRVPDWEAGLSASIRHGATLLSPQHHALLIGLGDQAGISAAVLHELKLCFESAQKITACCQANIITPPVIFPRHELSLLGTLNGDEGAGKHLRYLAQLHPERIDCIATKPVIDIDKPEDWQKLN